MDFVETIKKDKAYLKCKMVVKNWEKDFKEKHSRIPSKFDIKEAPSKIKYAYKKYFQLKSDALEKSIIGVDENADESFESPEPVLRFDHAILEPLSPDCDQVIPILPSGQELGRLLELAKKTKGNDQVVKPNPFTDNLSKRLFQNKKFAIRNPRKLLATKCNKIVYPSNDLAASNNLENMMHQTNNVESKQSFSKTSPSLLFNIEEVINKSCQMPESFIDTCNLTSKPVVRQINAAWLKRASNNDNIDSNIINNTIKTNEADIKKFGLSNINEITADVTKYQKHEDYVENSESEPEDAGLNKLKPALKKLKPDNILDETENRHSEFSLKSEKPSKQTNSKKKSNKSAKIKIEVPTTMKVTELSEPPEVSEYLPFGLEDGIVPRYENISNYLNTVNIERDIKKDVKGAEQINNLQKKINNGSINDNFVKINIEKKVFVRGKKSMNFSKYKKQQWKDKKALHAGMEFPEAGKILCFKCGHAGHMARFCTAHRGDTLLPLEACNESEMPSLEDMENIVLKTRNNLTLPDTLSQSIMSGSKIPESFIQLLSSTTNGNKNELQPIYSTYQAVASEEVKNTLLMFGHNYFRPGQEQTVMRILSGLPTLLILSTGGGKSLCYQIPAYIYAQHYKCITLVISPLVSLMEDQVLSMPEFLKAACLHTNQTATQRSKVVKCLKDGLINILLISPEALISSDSINGFMGLFKSLPQIAFACIDEAHCVSQWSHNFRPSYLMLCRVLREKLNVKCILGLTATASKSTIQNIISHINIPDKIEGVITNPSLPDNLCLSVSIEKDKDKALVSYLTSETISNYNSIIIYCIRRDECERVAALLRSSLQNPGHISMEARNIKKRKRMSYIAEAYHAGMSSAQRKKMQKHFMDGTLRIIVATVAFGMGINKPNIRCIIHYNMPSSFESYVQEVGRAGRDGHLAYCHVFISNGLSDKNELSKYIYANTIDRPLIRKLLQKIFIPCNCKEILNKPMSEGMSNEIRCQGHEVGIPIDKTVEDLDLPLENIATLLCYIELHDKKYIKVLNNAYITCKISSYGGPQKIMEATKTCPPLAMAYLTEMKKDTNITKQNVLEFQVIEVASTIGWQSGMTKYYLKNLEWITENGFSKRSLLKVEFNTLGFRVKAPGDLTPPELDKLLDYLHQTVLNQEKNKLNQLEESMQTYRKFSCNSFINYNFTKENLDKKSIELKSTIKNYFERDNVFPDNLIFQKLPLDEERIISDIRGLITSYKDCTFTGRSIARIFQGISSPNYPALVWGRCKYWRSHLHEDFYGIMRLATEQILQLKD